jgi:hypothetical protein
MDQKLYIFQISIMQPTWKGSGRRVVSNWRSRGEILKKNERKKTCWYH